MHYLIYLFLFYYSYKVILYLLEFIELKRLLFFFESQFEEIRKQGNDLKENDFVPLIRRKPVINKFLRYNPYSSSFSYGSSLNSLVDSSLNIYHSLLEILNTREYNWRKQLNPLYQLKNLFFVPAQLLIDSGFNLTKIQSLLINVFTYFVGFFLTMFSNEIKDLILGIFR